MSKPSTMIGLAPGRPSRDRQGTTLASLQNKGRTVRVNFDLDREMHMKLKLHTVASDISICDFIRQLLAKELSA